MNDPEILHLNNCTFKRLISAKEIDERIIALSQKIKNDMGEDDIPLFICIIKGAYVFASDLLRHYDGLCEVEFMRISTYSGTESTGSVKTYQGMDFDIVKGRRVVIIEDIVDTGFTMSYLLGELQKYEPKSLSIASLFVKPSKLCHEVKVDYSCFDIPDAFIVGYGLDYNQLYRNLPAIYVKE